MRNSTRSQRYVNDGVRYGQRQGRGWRRSLALLTLTLGVSLWSSTSALARQSSVFGPALTATATRVGAQDPLTPDQQRKIGETLAECEGLAGEAETLREERNILRRAVKLLEQSNGVLSEAVKVSAERADAESRRADTEHGLRVAAQEARDREIRKGKWRAVKWSAVVGAVAVVVGFAAGGE